ncbi:PqqD family protein, partial [bacterium]|nr:PqqD family protein [bacterium]
MDENRVPPDCCDLLKLVGEDRLFFARRHAPRWLLVNTLGAEVLHLCNGRRSLHEITELIRTRYDRPSAEIERDV